MILTDEIKNKIHEEFNKWVTKQYGDNSKATRKKLGQFYTPPEITIQMIEKFDNLEGKILDPCCGSGNLLAGCIIAGADPNNIYGNEFDENIVKIAQDRLCALGVPKWHIHQGDALKASSYEFSEDYVMEKEMEQLSLW